MKYRLISVLLMLGILLSLCACGLESGTQTQASDTSSSTETTAIGALADSGNYYSTSFGQGEVTDVNVVISADDWQDILDNPEAEEYHTADITVNGTTVNNVAIRTKGFSSLSAVASSDSDRYGFKIKLDKYVDGQTLNGLDMFVLNGSFADPSYMREYLTYLASAYLGCNTPYISYCNLYVNGDLFGFYLMIEAYNDSFVERYTNSNDTVLYKAESENCTLLTSDDATGFDVQYGDDDGNSNIKNLISILNSTTADNKATLEGILDVDSVLKALAVNTVMGNYDSYSGSKAHNYYLLYSEGKFTYLGWDYNMSIGGFSEDNGASVTVDVTSPVYGVEISQRPLIEKLLAIETYQEKYLGYIDELTTYFSDFETTVNGIANEIRSYIENDPSAFYTIDEFEANITESDTDLTQVEGKANGMADKGGMQAQNGGTMGNPGTTDNANASSGSGTGNAPNGSYGPDSTSDDGYAFNNSGERPTMPDVDTQNQSPPSGMPSRDGQTQENFGGDAQQRMGGSMINTQAVSIVDYITQRIGQIKTQLSY